MDNYKIYAHINKINGKVYVGQTKQELSKRWGNNGRNYKNCSQFYAAIQKYGWNNFEHILIEEYLSQDQANERECYWIKFYNSFEKGYNATTGGNLNKIFSEEAKQKMSKSKKESYKGIGNPNYGKHWSEEVKQKIREGNLGKTISEETREKMKKANKHKWLGKKHSEETKKKLSKIHSKKVICLQTGKIFDSAIKAAEWAGVTSAAIGYCCKGKSKTSGKDPFTGERLSWKFYEEIGG